MQKSRLFFWSITIALGGFLFGFDTAVISGAEQSIQHLWHLSDVKHGLAMAIALYGTVLGALLGGLPADAWGRKRTLIMVALLYLVSAIGSAMAPEVYSFMVFRFIGGIGVGASSVVAPIYISELAPPARRGRLVILFQLNIVLGIFLAYLSNYLIGSGSETSWRWMLGVEAVPAFLFFLFIFGVPESPRWLFIRKKDEKEASRIVTLVDPDHAVEILKMIRNAAHEAKPKRFSFELFSGKYNFPILLAVLIAVFNQLTGINAVIYYAPRIFDLTGITRDSALLSTVGIGSVNMIFTFLGMAAIDRFGRKTLMYFGSFGLILALGLLSRAFYLDIFKTVPYLLFLYIAFFALSQGAVIWVFISEIFPNRVRAAGQSLGSFTHWTMAAVMTNAFPFFVNKFHGGPIFLFFFIMMLFQLLFVWKIMPEARHISLEELGRKMVRRK
ncbi:MAG: sugar porter family MFS transporter [Bacteroidales bacterium]|nr:sugar porter family MFS transporter [Bacteroidales bacterium]